MYRYCVLIDERPVISDNMSAGNSNEIDNNEIKAWSDERQMKIIVREEPKRAEKSLDQFTAFY